MSPKHTDVSYAQCYTYDDRCSDQQSGKKETFWRRGKDIQLV